MPGSARLAVVALVVVPLTAVAADPPKPDPVERALAVQQVLARAQGQLAAHMPADAVKLLEDNLAGANGSPAYLALLRAAYAAELRQLEASPGAAPDRLALIRRQLARLDPPAVVPAVTPAPTPVADPLASAAEAFRAEDYAAAGRRYAAAHQQGVALSAGHSAAWAYCRVKAAADRVNAPGCDPATATAVVADVTAALALAPDNAKLQRFGTDVLAAARARLGAVKPPANGVVPAAAAVPASAAGDVVELASVRVRFAGNRQQAEVVAKAAEAKRTQIFERWSGPAAGAWSPKLDIVVHPTAAAYAAATGKPAVGTGHATVTLAAGKVAGRRIDLRADDPTLVVDALPRELTHVVLADLFPDRPPPKWAQEGMAVLACSPEEVSRYIRTLSRCQKAGELVPLAALFDAADYPGPDKVTGFCCQSVSVVDYLTRVGGERNFTIFVRDGQRYGQGQALKRNFNLDGPAGLQAAWQRAALEPTARGQGK